MTPEPKKLDVEKRNQKLIEQAKDKQAQIREAIEQIRRNAGLNKDK